MHDHPAPQHLDWLQTRDIPYRRAPTRESLAVLTKTKELGSRIWSLHCRHIAVLTETKELGSQIWSLHCRDVAVLTKATEPGSRIWSLHCRHLASLQGVLCQLQTRSCPGFETSSFRACFRRRESSPFLCLLGYSEESDRPGQSPSSMK